MITFIFYYFPPIKRFQKIVLIISSFIFYSFNQYGLLLILISVITVNIFTTYIVLNAKNKYSKLCVILGLAINILILVVFKYSGFIARTFLDLNGSFARFLISIPLPIGISFYIFKSISLVVDVFTNCEKKKILNNQRNVVTHVIETCLYISFFPQILSGPISRANDFIPQVCLKQLKDIDWENCFKSIVMGFFLKMVIADNLKDQTCWMAYPLFFNFSSLSLITMTYGFSMQMFSDFAGYSYIAIGVAGLFGYKTKDNFYFPYISKSFSEFWRRWHISLSTFLRDYLYIPLGGNRKGRWRTYFNLIAVMFLGGLWHGAGWSYAVWGAFHGILLSFERMMKNCVRFPKYYFIYIIRMLFVFIMVSLAWIFFKLPDLTQVIQFCNALLANAKMAISIYVVITILLYSAPVIIYHVCYIYRKNIIKYQSLQYLLYGMMLFLIITNSASPREFIYLQF